MTSSGAVERLALLLKTGPLPLTRYQGPTSAMRSSARPPWGAMKAFQAPPRLAACALVLQSASAPVTPSVAPPESWRLPFDAPEVTSALW